jgi:hypothetical protein
MKIYNNEQDNKVPGFEYGLEKDYNPAIRSDASPFEITFYQTRESMMDVENYRKFLDNAIARFRKSITYTVYKSKLIDMGMDRCQLHGNITTEMATVEMHHNILTLFDIAHIITEHILNTKGYISSFDLVVLLKQVHTSHKVQLVMLSLTPHQLYHNSEGLYIHPSMCFGNWLAFLNDYRLGITIDIANKIIMYIDESIKSPTSYDSGLLDLRKNIIDWSIYNERL